ncbi:bifunctional demethylmenaquinone methyltransferase/2-methoxy-6-polyprenyl-1,4-benzoquinol methylase UbiE [Cyanobacterium stanieri LEGE 03274]|uniref:2-phytyl-1,4-naphtoquinone methyltransferase n=1 Tax=Cyanobacterium stanieri LEGE 03274 TaxID=1828756 RepID=A0ABR9V4F6_9CHRO|nr:bifunctional demethylmenaquinone methyltransferase/2-methoxy-6-polyprenyl-1,4-benzoquinol methylase UbiE [Cyanobacterium stanieri]MBE9222775.1 bifunctional demethylmenaquinone methyltransferase/2-methoxy-6-polyprenyl-1,4-benzoquinol methylase UbiE [Cyanobacterium stanieri LEGE 03274]
MTSSTKPTDKEIQNIFNNIAPIYDQMNNWLSFGVHHVWKKMAVKWSNAQPHHQGLDLCCGTGDLTFLLAKQITHGKVYGVDFSPQLLAVAQEKQQQKPSINNITWIESDVLTLPFDDNTFDCATMGYGLRNVVDIPLALQEIHRVLKPNSKVAILDFHRPSDSLLAQAQRWYIDNIVVNMAQYFGSTAEYAYINPSLDRFPCGEEQIKLGQKAGFNSAIHYPLAGGIMGVLVLTK